MDNDTKIIIRDDLPPESMAMLQALYSRSPASVLDHIKKVEAVGPEKFMSKYLVGYGHKSIGDCGTTTLFIEGVSLLAAKAIQDWPLYRGQEASTRYMDFSTARIDDPVGTPGSGEIQADWMQFYHASQGPVREHLLALYPKEQGEKDDVYERAIDARKFDILRAFLPAGATTNLSWHTDLRQAQDHLRWLEEHPDATIRYLADLIGDYLIGKYPSSFENARRPGGEAHHWREAVASQYTYFDRPVSGDHYLKVSVETRLFTESMPNDLRELVRRRPKGAELPPWMAKYGSVRSTFPLDFGSFRDLQRHRNGVVTMPLLTTRLGFNDWYLSALPIGVRASAERLIEIQKSRIHTLGLAGVSKVEQQYYCALGFDVSCEVTQGLPAFVYRLELRTSPSVHPTLRRVVQREADVFRTLYPEITLHDDRSPDAWDTRRGKQTITERA